jgi:hypothetical protein
VAGQQRRAASGPGHRATRLLSRLRLFSYVVRRDFGFAPNPFGGCCTLATCKPRIRGTAAIGDWVMGTGSAEEHRVGDAVFAMRVDEILTFDEYWAEARFAAKRPDLRGSRKRQFGDNIYRHGDAGEWLQLDSHHSLHDGRPNPGNVATDTGVDRMLVSRHFVYWGGTRVTIPARFRSFGPDGEDVCIAGQHHKCRFSEALVSEVVEWLEGFGAPGRVGRPWRWSRMS